MVFNKLMGQKKHPPIPDDHHIARHVPWNKLRKDHNDNVIGVLGEAFQLRPTERYLSATHLECFPGTYDQQKELIVKEVRKYFNVKPKSYFAIGKVGDIKALCHKERNLKLRIVSFPTNCRTLSGSPFKNKSHVSIAPLPSEDMKLLELIASEVWNDLIANNSIP